MVRDNLLIVRRGLSTSRIHIKVWGGKWERAKRNRRKGLHPRRRALFLRVAGVNRLVFHGPPRPHNASFPKRRQASIRFYERARDLLRTWIEKGHRPYLVEGDFNLNRQQVGKRLPGTVQIPQNPDGFVHEGLEMTDVQVHDDLPGWYDHPLITATIHY